MSIRSAALLGLPGKCKPEGERRERVKRCVNSQLPIPNFQDTLQATDKTNVWELEVGSWELIY